MEPGEEAFVPDYNDAINKDQNPLVKCPVVACISQDFKDMAELKKHWNQTHEPTQRVFECPKPNCPYVSPRARNVKRHTTSIHPEINPNETFLTSTIENVLYVSPGDATYPFHEASPTQIKKGLLPTPENQQENYLQTYTAPPIQSKPPIITIVNNQLTDISNQNSSSTATYSNDKEVSPILSNVEPKKKTDLGLPSQQEKESCIEEILKCDKIIAEQSAKRDSLKRKLKNYENMERKLFKARYDMMSARLAMYLE